MIFIDTGNHAYWILNTILAKMNIYKRTFLGRIYQTFGTIKGNMRQFLHF